MFLSKSGYYADFVVLPVMLGLLATSWANRTGWQRVQVLAACALGLALYTLLEYAWHRYVQHRLPTVKRTHARHHGNPLALVGTPAWITAGAGLAVLLLLWWPAGWGIASGLTFGLMLGCLWYSLFHHALHHWPARRGGILHRLKRRHYFHHHAPRACNFGITTSLWDRVFGSEWRRNRYAA